MLAAGLHTQLSPLSKSPLWWQRERATYPDYSPTARIWKDISLVAHGICLNEADDHFPSEELQAMREELDQLHITEREMEAWLTILGNTLSESSMEILTSYQSTSSINPHVVVDYNLRPS